LESINSLFSATRLGQILCTNGAKENVLSMNSRCFLHPQQDFSMVPFSSNSVTEDRVSSARNRPPRVTPPSFLVRVAMRISRARWFTFLRRVFHYQNGSRSNLGSNPFNSSTWMMLEFIALVVQITITTFTLAISKRERPIWPMRIWISGYDIGVVLNLLLLYGRYRQIYLTQGDALGVSDIEQQRNHEETRYHMQFNFFLSILLLVIMSNCI